MTMRPLALDDRSLVVDYLRRFPPEISELTFTNLYAWHRTRQIWLDTFRDSLVFFTELPTGLVIFGNPVGPVTLAEVLFDYGNQIIGADRFPKAMVPDASLLPGIKVVADRDNNDYVYHQEQLVNLAGRHFTKKRNHINQCLAAYSCEYEIITPEITAECLDLQERWCVARACRDEPGLCGENLAIKETLRHYQDFDLIGGAIRIAGTIQAFSIGEPLNSSTAVCHFEKSMPEFQGLGQLINQWFAKNSLAAFDYINREQDLGVPGLRLAKESYFPDHLVEKVQIMRSGSSIDKPVAQQRCD